MIAEHEFVTTFEQEEALAAASHILSRMGFFVRTYEARLVAKRGEDKPAKAKRERELPQRVEMTFDRGRCTLAASITLAAKAKPVHRDMVKTALNTLERVLVHGQTDDEAIEDWRLVDRKASAKTAPQRVLLWVLLGFLGLLLIGCIVGMLVSLAGP